MWKVGSCSLWIGLLDKPTEQGQLWSQEYWYDHSTMDMSVVYPCHLAGCIIECPCHICQVPSVFARCGTPSPSPTRLPSRSCSTRPPTCTQSLLRRWVNTVMQWDMQEYPIAASTVLQTCLNTKCYIYLTTSYVDTVVTRADLLTSLRTARAWRISESLRKCSLGGTILPALFVFWNSKINLLGNNTRLLFTGRRFKNLSVVCVQNLMRASFLWSIMLKAMKDQQKSLHVNFVAKRSQLYDIFPVIRRLSTKPMFLLQKYLVAVGVKCTVKTRKLMIVFTVTALSIGRIVWRGM